MVVIFATPQPEKILRLTAFPTFLQDPPYPSAIFQTMRNLVNKCILKKFVLKQNFMKIEFENSIRRLVFLCRLADIKIVWINP